MREKFQKKKIHSCGNKKKEKSVCDKMKIPCIFFDYRQLSKTKADSLSIICQLVTIFTLIGVFEQKKTFQYGM